MRYSASEKLEIIRLVEQSPLPVKRALEKLGIPRGTSYAGAIFIRAAGSKP
jgi:putative transposase